MNSARAIRNFPIIIKESIEKTRLHVKKKQECCWKQSIIIAIYTHKTNGSLLNREKDEFLHRYIVLVKSSMLYFASLCYSYACYTGSCPSKAQRKASSDHFYLTSGPGNGRCLQCPSRQSPFYHLGSLQPLLSCSTGLKTQTRSS